jgi:hypothetical protein
MDGGFCKRQKMVNQRKINKKSDDDHRFFFGKGFAKWQK